MTGVDLANPILLASITLDRNDFAAGAAIFFMAAFGCCKKTPLEGRWEVR
jgi:hypothetical protein